MKKRLRITAAFAAMIISAGLLGGCGSNSENEESNIPTAASVVSSEDYAESSEESEYENSDEKSYTMVTTDESADESSSESSSDESSSEDSDESTEFSFVSMTESEAIEASNIGYEFDDEQIVTDYHTAETFTDNDFFNELFKNNALDQAFTEETKRASSTSDMINLTSEYAIKWKEIADTAYKALGRDLDEENNQKLKDSQKQWSSGLAAQEEAFRSEGAAGGSEAALDAQTAIMNYYKGRAAKLFEQIYSINGSIDLSEYGL